MELVESLQNLGLNEKEARCYLALLPLRKATAYMVAVRSGLKKPTAYVILESLVNKSFVLKIPHQDKTFYVAKSPKDCMDMARTRMKLAYESLPELMAIQKENDDKVSTAYFEGMDGVNELYDRMLKIMKQKPRDERIVVGFSAHQQDTSELLQKYWIKLNEDFAKSNIERKSITTKHETVEEYLQVANLKKYKTKIKALADENYSSNISIEVYDNFAQIVSHRHMQGILIENPDVANTLKQIFSLVWKLSKEKTLG